jgi:hypothetical protein
LRQLFGLSHQNVGCRDGIYGAFDIAKIAKTELPGHYFCVFLDLANRNPFHAGRDGGTGARSVHLDQATSAVDIAPETFRPTGRTVVPKHMLEQAKQLPPHARIAPNKIGRQAMLINFWSLTELANQEAGVLQNGYTVLGEPEDIHAATLLGNDLVSDPMRALTKLKRGKRKR